MIDPEYFGAHPRYIPGDIVHTLDGGVGVIIQAYVVVNGLVVNWNQTMHGTIRHAMKPQYSIDNIPGFKKPFKMSGWTADEFTDVVIGNLHQAIEHASAVINEH